MKEIRTRRGLDLPYYFRGSLDSVETRLPKHIALMGTDFPFKPHFTVEPGQTVKRGDTLFHAKDDERIRVFAPVSGTVTAINRGAKRVFESLTIHITDPQSYLPPNGQPLSDSPMTSSGVPSATSRSEIVSALLAVGAWNFFRTRPFSRIPNPDSEPEAIFVNAMDTRPGAVSPAVLLSGREADICRGLEIFTQLTTGSVYFCHSSQEPWAEINGERIQKVAFSGKHPAGLPSTHIHFLRPASLKHKVWTIPVDLACDIGEYFRTGVLPNRKTIALTGQGWDRPALVQTLVGAKISELITDHLTQTQGYRIVSGSILHGWTADSSLDYLGRFHRMVSLVPHASHREFVNWILPSLTKYSVTRTVWGRFRKMGVQWNDTLQGSPRAIIPVGHYERVMPLDILPTQLLRALVTQDWETAVELGALELEEEDLSLCTFVCAGKLDYGRLLRDTLEEARRELS